MYICTKISLKNLIMKKITLLSLFVLTSSLMVAQKDNTEIKNASQDYNRWTIEASVGYAKGIRNFAPGYYSSNPKAFFGDVLANSFTLGTRYMFGPKFGIKGAVSYESLENIKKNGSLPWKMEQYGLAIQGYVNLNRLFSTEDEFGRFGFLFHAGVKADRMSPQTADEVDSFGNVLVRHNKGRHEYNGGIVVGLTPQFRITKKLAFTADVTLQHNFRQHFNWDGSYSDKANNLDGQQVTVSLGLNYSLGKRSNLSGDYEIIKTEQTQEIDALNTKIADLEKKMEDTDRDGVPDYLDAENNSIAGVAVDTKGRMVDLNKNGVPDELERYLSNSGAVAGGATNGKDGNNSSNMIKNLINENYISTYFDLGKTVPTNVSTEGIDFILMYLRNNPSSKVDIIGHADELGTNDFNNKLAAARAESVKQTLIKAGVEPSRLNVVARGEDTSVDPNSEAARRLVRRVTFRAN